MLEDGNLNDLDLWASDAEEASNHGHSARTRLSQPTSDVAGRPHWQSQVLQVSQFASG